MWRLLPPGRCASAYRLAAMSLLDRIERARNALMIPYSLAFALAWGTLLVALGPLDYVAAR